MNYDIEADWMLFHTCNYRCDYCFFSAATLGQKVHIHAGPDEWSAAFDRTGKTWLVHLTGGEPSHYPDFADLTAALTRRHFISLNSNLTGPALQHFSERIDPARVSFINAGLHPEERERRGGHAVFLRHAGMLLARGFPVMVSVVATPNALRDFEAIIESLRPIGIVPFPKLMQGRKLGGRYPSSYTAEERDLFRRYSRQAQAANPALFDGRRERPSIDPTRGRKHLGGNPRYHGQMCTAGRDFVRIDPNGEVRRCGNGPLMGNLLTGPVQFADAATPCDRSHCFYFCEKFTRRAAQQEWQRAHPIAAFAKRVKRQLAAAR
jgi:MoaA/NifB/PqqE/SkfB family radical SAM enzyme